MVKNLNHLLKCFFQNEPMKQVMRMYWLLSQELKMKIKAVKE